jgi:hypothetical protein
MPTFPAIKPDYFTAITMPEYKGKDIEFDDGGVQTVQTQFRPKGVSFALRYEQLSVANVNLFWAFWDTVNGTNGRFDLPDVVLRMPLVLVNRFNLSNAGGNVWRFESKFSFNPVVADRGNDCSIYSTQIQIRGELK